MTTIDTAARQYANRPTDERFGSLEALHAAALADKNLSGERTFNLKDLRVVPTSTPDPTVNDLALVSPKGGEARFTHWSFGQLARVVGAPASYLRDLSPELAADCLNYGLHETMPGSSANLLLRAANGSPFPIVRACTSDAYGRCWDADLYGATLRQVTANDSRWQLPPTWSGEAAGAYRGDRDSFLILVNGGSIVSDPSLTRGGQGGDAAGMFRGILIRNSEVGASSVVIETILYRYVCGNHMLWGAMIDTQFKRRHIGSNVTRDVIREIGSIAYKWANASPARDEAIIRGLIDHEIAASKDAVVDELRAMGASKDQAIEAFARCEQTEAVSPRSFWGMAQGLTRLSQDSPYQDGRYELDRLAAVVLARGRKLVAA